MEELTDEPLYRDRVCATTSAKAQLLATIRVPPDEGGSGDLPADNVRPPALHLRSWPGLSYGWPGLSYGRT